MLLFLLACFGRPPEPDSDAADDSSADEAQGPVLAAQSLDFDEVVVGCTADAAFVFGNRGDAALTLKRMSWEGDVAIGFDFPAMPIELDPDQTMDLEASFTPTREGDATGTLVVESSDPRGDLGFGVLGTGVSGEPCE